jgi:hypothetical protein
MPKWTCYHRLDLVRCTCDKNEYMLGYTIYALLLRLTSVMTYNK